MQNINENTITLNTSILIYVQSYWQDLKDDYRTLIGVEAVRNNVNMTSLNLLRKTDHNSVSTFANEEYS